ncbi:MAG: DUF1707 and DUF2154 domain-containing protein [Gammaproteobacteria bacterium]|nr:DUF1707 and DUF2154 domain-containing protein [Gammaproteobacteria bacterium]
MQVTPQDRPIEALREEVIDQLIMNYGHRQLSLEAFERRLDAAMEASNHNILIKLTADLDLTIDQEFINSKKQQMGINYVPGVTEDVEYIYQIFSGSDRTGEWKLPKEIRIFSIFSGANIDLTDAIFTNSEVYINIFNIFSGDNIYVPENVNVQTNVFCIFGAIDNCVSSSTNSDAPTITIKGFALFGGISVKIKRTLKERVIIFADKLKSFLTQG